MALSMICNKKIILNLAFRVFERSTAKRLSSLSLSYPGGQTEKPLDLGSRVLRVRIPLGVL